MSRWPVITPIDPRPPRINLRGAPPDPSTFDGPLNLFIELHGTAVAANTAEATLDIYEENNPPADSRRQTVAGDMRVVNEPKPSPPMPTPKPAPPSTIRPAPVSPGKPIDYQGGVPDPDIVRRIHRPRVHKPD